MFATRVPHSLNSDALVASVKSGPPVAVTALSVAGVGLQDWVYILTIVWLLGQMAFAVGKRVIAWRNRTHAGR